MKAVVLKRPHEVAIEEVDKPAILEPTDVLMRVELTAICGTDLHPFEGRLPVEENVVLGHEFLGTVEEVGSSVKLVSPGDRAVASCVVHCGHCWACRKHQPARCASGRIFGLGIGFGGLAGGQAEYVRVPNADLILRTLPDQGAGTDEDILFVGDIMATGYEAVRRAFTPGDVVAIVGAGPVGLCAAMSARALGAATVVVIDRVPVRLQEAAQLGAVGVNADTDDPATAVLDLTGSRGADVVVDAVGHPSALATACRLARPGGAISVAGAYTEEAIELPFGELWVKGISITGGIANVVNYMDETLALINSGALRPSRIISHRMPLSKAEEAYSLFHAREATKIVMDPRS
jgi:2-desacetyl-2-hydroxyethyl bacteriochlorophyllide A dehydrogenase